MDILSSRKGIRLIIEKYGWWNSTLKLLSRPPVVTRFGIERPSVGVKLQLEGEHTFHMV